MHVDAQIAAAYAALQAEKLVAMPTETVYGLAAPYDDLGLVHKIFQLKNRPLFDPLIVHLAEFSQAFDLVEDFPSDLQELARHFWPGPLTMVLKKSDRVHPLITSGQDTVALRIPKSELALKFIRAVGRPVVAPSANLFKKTSPTRAEHVREFFSTEDVFVLDGGPCSVGIESTIVAPCGGRSLQILRPGLISESDFKALGFAVVNQKSAPQVPGQLVEHYMPQLPLFLAIDLSAEEIAQQLAERSFHSFEPLQLPTDPLLAARQLYQLLRTESTHPCLLLPLSSSYFADEKWLAILDRLQRASSGILRKS